ncbi:MAG: HlyD family type I secretion periplasmic adaptor subunit [Rhodospirillales bacterium]|nr:HlyD family type I secretion periplasmic adaptor subunit [Rhodospirillales bacterium]MCW8861970.1 HlyD family type I secretion periplasmic adaptor subunit [Rhodospirillales bacterium]MCW8951425.1 HlyD family type I secretion periplasmic adaptor subunit [Rhodospirillales bacterium]MCW9001749.1 HlyD family type I secretion periplasmic adaptor subunit [Rhodospirillales bacterium]
MSTLDTMLETRTLPGWRKVARIIMAGLTIVIVWSAFAQLDEVSVAMGEVVPVGKVRVIQHLEGGIIESIDVREGGVVSVDDPLVRLNLATGGTNIEELQVRMDGSILARARLIAEAAGTEPEFPEDVASRRATFVEAERRAFDARANELKSTLNLLNEQRKQRDLEVQELESKRKSLEKNLKLGRERLKMSSSLLSQGLTPKMEHLQLEAEIEQMEGELQSITSTIPKTKASVAEAEERIREETSRFRREAQENLGQVEQTLARVQELLNQANEQGFRAQIRSPIDGVVKNLRYHTIGGVVRPGEAIMEIVPTGEKLVVDARLNPIDRGYVMANQTATVKISTYDFVRYGGLEGKVILIAADTTVDKDGSPYYRVVVETDKAYLGDEEGKLPITPGMEATVDIHTGTRSVLDYLIKPVLKLRHEAFRER